MSSVLFLARHAKGKSAKSFTAATSNTIDPKVQVLIKLYSSRGSTATGNKAIGNKAATTSNHANAASHTLTRRHVAEHVASAVAHVFHPASLDMGKVRPTPGAYHSPLSSTKDAA
jgi:hypothetical protein